MRPNLLVLTLGIFAPTCHVQVVDFIQETIENKLTGANSSRNFLTQSLMPGATPVDTDEDANNRSAKKVAAPQKQVCAHVPALVC